LTLEAPQGRIAHLTMIRSAIWGAAFVAQWIFIAAFIWLQKKIIAELNSSAKVSVSNPSPVYL
jgi:hypothetical protein